MEPEYGADTFDASPLFGICPLSKLRPLQMRAFHNIIICFY
jgi:hypothetical protein